MKTVKKVGWSITLDEGWEDRWSQRALQSVKKNFDKYNNLINIEILQAKDINKYFLPLYFDTISKKKNYHLSVNDVMANFERISVDSSYKLVWFTSKNDGQVIGGNVIHELSDFVKGVYRSYDHDVSKELGLRVFDYYADFVLQNLLFSKGIRSFSRGLMAHPCDNLGLSMFKLRTGCRPKFPIDPIYINITQDEIVKRAKKDGVCLFYETVNIDNCYGSAQIFIDANGNLPIDEYKTLANRAGITTNVYSV